MAAEAAAVELRPAGKVTVKVVTPPWLKHDAAAAVTLGDLTHQGQAEAPAAGVLSGALGSEEGLEDALDHGRRNAPSMVAHGDDNRRAGDRVTVGQRNLDRRRAVFQGVVDQIADQPAKQPG